MSSMTRLRTTDRRGAVMIYVLFLMTIFFAMTSLAVDYARVTLTKTELQRAADQTAHSTMALFAAYGASTAYTYGPFIATSSYNPIDSGSGVTPTVSNTWGYWDKSTSTFTTYPYSSTLPTGKYRAVKTTISCSAGNGNGMPLVFGRLIGRSTVDVYATSTAILNPTQVINFTASSTKDPWLAGMPTGSTASYDDTAPTDAPTSILNVTPGTTLTFSNVSGLVNHTPATAVDDPNGHAGSNYSHMMDSPDGDHNGVQNGIGDVVMPIDSMLGLFLDGNAPNTTAAPTVVRDYSTQAARDQTFTNDLLTKQPFFVGDGNSSTGSAKSFVVPAGATRLYMGIMDGYEWNNNNGSFTGTVTVNWFVQTVQ